MVIGRQSKLCPGQNVLAIEPCDPRTHSRYLERDGERPVWGKRLMKFHPPQLRDFQSFVGKFPRGECQQHCTGDYRIAGKVPIKAGGIG